MMMEDHLLPMISVYERSSGDLVAQIFNFVDTCLGGEGGIDKLSADTVEKFLTIRGIIKSDVPIKDKKEKEAYTLINESSYLKKEEHEAA